MAVQSRTDLRSAYLYLVCLVTLVLAIFAAVNLVRSATSLAYPDPGYYGLETPEKVDEEQLGRQRELAKESQRRQAVQGLVGSGAMLLLTAPAYLYHWRQVQSLALRGPREDAEA